MHWIKRKASEIVRITKQNKMNDLEENMKSLLKFKCLQSL